MFNSLINDILNCLWPKELLLEGIICVIWFIAFIIFCRILSIRSTGKRNIEILDDKFNSEDCVNELAYAVHTGNRQKWNAQKYLEFFSRFSAYKFDKKINENDVLKNKLTEINPDEAENLDGEIEERIRNFKWENKAGSAVIEHIKVIYEAGCNRNRIEPQILIQNTVSKVFSGAETIHTMINLFLVCGILGTLSGLALCISSFTISNEGKRVGESIIQGLNGLLSVLKGAFAPSIWGVLLTILFILVYSILVQEKCIDRFEDKLTKLTIKILMPKLCPTDFQLEEIAIAAKLKDQAENAKEINNGAVALVENIKNVNGCLSTIEAASKQIEKGIENFKDDHINISKITEALTTIQDNIITSKQCAVSLVEAKQDFMDSKQVFFESIVSPILQQQKMYYEGMDKIGDKIEQIIDPLDTAKESLKTMLYKVVNTIEERNQALHKDILQETEKTFQNMSEEINALMSKNVNFDGKIIENQVQRINENLEKLCIMLKDMSAQMKNINDGYSRAGSQTLNVSSTRGSKFDLFERVAVGFVVVLLAVGIGVQGMTLMSLKEINTVPNKLEVEGVIKDENVDEVRSLKKGAEVVNQVIDRKQYEKNNTLEKVVEKNSTNNR